MTDALKLDPGKFAREVRQEGAKITWPSRKEVVITTIMVLWMVVLASIFLFFVDFLVQHLIKGVLHLFA